jgi:hypothetical protein
MMAHLRSVHPAELLQADQPSEDKSKDKIMATPQQQFFAPRQSSAGKRKGAVSDALADLVIDGGFPFSLTDNKAIRRAFIKIAEVSGGHLTDKDLCSRRTVTRKVINKLDRGDFAFASTVAEELTSQDDVSVAWTNDKSTSKAGYPYTALTMSLITEAAELKEFFVACDYDHGVHDANGAFEQMMKAIHSHIPILKDLEPKNCITVATFDCGSNTPSTGLVQHGVESLSCVAHRISTLLKHMETDEELQPYLKDIYSIINTIKLSSKNTIELERVQLKDGVKVLRPKKGNATRFTFQAKTVDRFMRIYPQISKMDVDKMYFKDSSRKFTFRDNRERMTTDVLPVMTVMLGIYRKFTEWCVRMQSGRDVTLSKVLYMLDDFKALMPFMKGEVERLRADDDTALKGDVANICNRIIDEFTRQVDTVFCGERNFNSYWYFVSEALDPSVAVGRPGKKINISKHVIAFYDDNPVCANIFKEDWKNNVPPIQAPPAGAEGGLFADDDDDEAAGGGAGFPPALALAVGGGKKADMKAQLITELALYKAKITDLFMGYGGAGTDEGRATQFKITSSVNPLAWWKKEKGNLPIMWRIAKKVLAAPAAVTASERVFSSLTDIVDSERTSLGRFLAGRLVVARMRAKQRFNASNKPPMHTPWSPFGKPAEAIAVFDYEDMYDSDYDPDSDPDADEDSDDEGVNDDDETFTRRAVEIRRGVRQRLSQGLPAAGAAAAAANSNNDDDDDDDDDEDDDADKIGAGHGADPQGLRRGGRKRVCPPKNDEEVVYKYLGQAWQKGVQQGNNKKQKQS